MIEYVVGVGDCIASIADRFKQTVQAIWDLPENAELRDARPDRWVLAPGDRVWVPEPTCKGIEVAAGKRHTFQRRGTHCELRVQMLLNGKPRANERFTLVIDGERTQGVTDFDGVLIAMIPASARSGWLELGDDEEPRPIRLGDLDPIDTPRGVQARLADLAYYFEEVDGLLGPYSAQAIRAFQRDVGLPATGALDDATRDSLLTAYGR